MRSVLYIILLLSLPTVDMFAQKGTIEAYSREDLLHKLEMGTSYVLPEFVGGEVHYSDGRVTKSSVNVCAFDNSLRFVSGKDTMIVKNIADIDYVIVPEHKFVYRDDMILEILCASPEVSLCEKKRLRISEPKMNQGSYGAVPASSSAKMTTTDDYRLGESRSYGHLVSIDYSVTWDYYLLDTEGHAQKVDRKAFLDAFPECAAQIKDVVKQKKIKFDKRTDVLYLYNYCLNYKK